MNASRSRHIAIAIVGIVLFACGPITQASTPVSAPSSAPTASPTNPPAAAAINTPPETQTIEPTPIPALPSSSPYFAFLTLKDDGSILTLLGTNGVGRKEIALPASNRTGNCLTCVLSPDGLRLAYWTGSAGNPQDANLSGSFDLQLNILRISDGTSAKITGLLSPDYPANFRANAEAIKGQSQFSGMDAASIASGLQMSFLWGIESAAWSPDGRYLAFAGEMDGPSSDLYVYDASDGSIRRLSSGSTNIIASGGAPIGWSPDGKWIVYTSTYFAGEGMTADIHAARPDGSGFRDYPESVESLSGWLTNSIFLFQQGENGIGEYRLESGNLDTGGTTMIWKCPFEMYAIDPQGSAIVFEPFPMPEWGCQNGGLFYKNISSGATQLLAGQDDAMHCLGVEFLGWANFRFLFSLGGIGTFTVSSAGVKTLLMNMSGSPTPSPDKQWVAIAGTGLRIVDDSGMRLIDDAGKISKQLTDAPIFGVTWRPDSQGLVFISQSNVYSLSLPDETITPLDGIPSPSRVDYIYWQPDSSGYFFLDGSNLNFLSLPEKKVVFLQTIPDPSSFDPLWVANP